MSQDFGIDNEGQGFDFDDDETDLEALLDKASKGAEDEGDDDSVLFFNNDQSKTEQRKEEPTQQEEYSNDDESFVFDNNSDNEQVDELVVENYATNNDTTVAEPEVDNSSITSPEPVKAEPEFVAPVQREPEPVYEQPTQQEQVAQAPPVQQENTNVAQFNPSKRPIVVKTEAEEIKDATKVINILDTYRDLPPESRSAVSQFVDNDDYTDEPSLVVKVLRADPILSQTMTALKDSAAETDRVERVFYILKLDTNLLYNLGSLVSTLVESEVEGRNDKIEYSKNIEATINTLDKKIIDYVAATKEVLAAAEVE